MKVFITEEFSYNGLFVETLRKFKREEYKEVELIGVPVPVDPGIVAVKEDGKIRYVPICVLEGVPQIDFKKLLTSSQIQERKALGCLLGPGLSTVNQDRKIIPIEEVPLIQFN